MKKQQTISQLETTKAKAERFIRDVLNDADRADQVADESLEDFAARKGVEIINPARRTIMANGNGGNGDDYDFSDWTKADCVDALSQVADLLDNVYTPESGREEMAAAIGDALDALSGEDTGDEGEDEDDQDDDGQ